MKKFPFYANISFEKDITGIFEQIVSVKSKFRELEEEVKKLDELINPRSADIEITD